MQNFILIIIVLIVGAFAFKSYQKQKAKTESEQSTTDLMLAVIALKGQREATKRAEMESKLTAKDVVNAVSNVVGTVGSIFSGGLFGGGGKV